MSKKVLALYYSQSGQLGQIVQTFLQPFAETGAVVEVVRIKPVNDFPFPWTSEQFFDAMPESVLAKPVPLEPFQLKEEKYDLVIFAYQPWYLSLSIPSLSIILHPSIQKVLSNTPVVTLIGARNMWLNSQERVKTILKESNAQLVGNIALVDRNANVISAVTILYWMLTGKKDKWLGLFPMPGVSNEDIRHTKTHGKMVAEYLDQANWNGMQAKLAANGAAEVKTQLMFIEQRAPRLFSIWANVIVKRSNRKLWLIVFKYYLLIALFIVAPIVLAIYSIFFAPFFSNSIRRKKQYYSSC